MKLYGKYLFIIFTLIASSCTYEFPEVNEDYSTGTLDLSGFISLGDGFTSGYMDGALFTDGQNNSFPAIIARQFAYAYSIDFIQPDINSENGYNLWASEPQDTKGKWISQYSTPEQADPDRILTGGELPGQFTGNLQATANYSVPFAKSFEIINSSLSNNIYYNRFASDPGNSSLLGDVADQNTGFIVLWIGMSDFINYAAYGGTGNPDPAEDPAMISTNDLSPENIFEAALDTIITRLFAGNQAKGLIVQLPQFEDMPFAYTYQYNFARIKNTVQFNSHYNSFNEAVGSHNIAHPEAKRPMIAYNDNFSTLSPQEVVVIDSSLPDAQYPDGSPLPKLRQLVEGEMVLLSISAEDINDSYGTFVPAAEEYYLSLDQVEIIKQRINAYNEAILNKVNQYPGRLSLVPLENVIHDIAETAKCNAWGRPNSYDIKYFEGVPLEGSLGLNSIFSLDGLHFNQRGNAFIANQLIEIINDQFEANIPLANVNSYLGNTVSY